MAVGDAQAAFWQAAARDGVVLEKAKVPWINQRGHYGLPPTAGAAVESLDRIFHALGGLAPEQQAERVTALPGDFFHAESGTFIETDELQHFTSFRLTTLDLYPDHAALGYDWNHYRALCHELAPKADRYRAAKPAAGFGPGGRQRQRAYNDALRDLATPATGHPPLIRIPLVDADGEGAYRRHRREILSALFD
ncbi:DUF7255 family protein [Sinomonas flava]|uniref:Uncharacterized protein n=1 Tax=Sinomonas flava TaxID=496857 RepID=A0ABN3BSV2_9MICC